MRHDNRMVSIANLVNFLLHPSWARAPWCWCWCCWYARWPLIVATLGAHEDSRSVDNVPIALIVRSKLVCVHVALGRIRLNSSADASN